MTDKELIQKIAEIWIASGGDSDGFLYCQYRIKDAIAELEQSKE